MKSKNSILWKLDPNPSVSSLFSPSSMQAMKKVQLLTCLSSPPRPERPKKEITGEAIPRSRAQNFSQQTVASNCKGCASNIQMTAHMLMDPVQVTRKRGRGGAVFSLFNGKHGRNAVVQCTQVIIKWLDKNGVNGANYSNKAAKSVSDCVVGRANGTKHRGEAERPKSQSNIESWVSIAIITMDYHC